MFIALLSLNILINDTKVIHYKQLNNTMYKMYDHSCDGLYLKNINY